MVDIPTFNAGGDVFGEDSGAQATGYIHIRNQQRNGKKSVTTIQGVPEKFHHKKILKAFKKNLNCNGAVVEDEEHGIIIQIQGDKRQDCADFLIHEGIAEKSHVKVHGV